jgi:hypothetical protein
MHDISGFDNLLIGHGDAQIGGGIITDVDDVTFDIIQSYHLFQNFPNLFYPTTTIKYQITESNFIILKVYDILGREITTLVQGEKTVGSYEVEFDATALPSGTYFYRLQAGNFVETKKMVLMK